MSSNRSSQDLNSKQKRIPRSQNSNTDSEGHRNRKRSLLSNFCVSIGDLKFRKTTPKCSSEASAVSSSEDFNEYTFNRELWKVKTKYSSLKTLSAGAFGTVWLAFDFHTSLSHSPYCPILSWFFLSDQWIHVLGYFRLWMF